MARNWTIQENQVIVSDYFAMLDAQFAERKYSKAEHYRAIRKDLPGRTKSSVEFKHQNISAILRSLGWPYVEGYAPLGNYQQALVPMVLDRIRASTDLARRIETIVDLPARQQPIPDILSTLVPPPRPESLKAVPTADFIREGGRGSRVVDYVAREAANRSLGAAGEEYVLQFEVARLRAAGQSKRVDSIERVSQTRGDWVGYDILSFEEDGTERLIEVKTTRFGDRTPFFVTRNELAVSRDRSAQYQVYRIFGFEASPRLFQMAGSIDGSFQLDPIVYRADPY